MRVLIDTSVLIRNPEVLAKAGAGGVTFVIPQAVLNELEAAGAAPDLQKLKQLVREAIERGLVEVPSEPTSLDENKLPGDLAIASYLARARERNEDVVVATEDRDLVQAANQLHVPVLSTSGLVKELTNSPVRDEALHHKARKFIMTQRADWIIKILVGMGLSLVGNLVIAKSAAIIATISVWGTIGLLLVTAVSLYWFRGRYRLVYGSAEFCVGFIASVRVFWPRFAYAQLSPADILQVVAGIYVMIRGLDNVGKASEGTRWQSRWRRLSGERP